MKSEDGRHGHEKWGWKTFDEIARKKQSLGSTGIVICVSLRLPSQAEATLLGSKLSGVQIS